MWLCWSHEQLTMCIRWVSADYVILEDFIGIYDCPNTLTLWTILWLSGNSIEFTFLWLETAACTKHLVLPMIIIPILNNMNNKNKAKSCCSLCNFSTTDMSLSHRRCPHISPITHFATDKQKRNTCPPLCVQKEHLHNYERCSYINCFFPFTKDKGYSSTWSDDCH